MEKVLVDQEIQSLDLVVKEGEKASLRLAAFSCFPNAEINVKVEKNASFEGAFADFSPSGGTFHLHIHLVGEGASATWKSASICSDAKKVFDTNLYHDVPVTEGTMENYGIVTDKGKLHFLGTSAIAQGAKGSSTRQSAKIIIFDENCDGRAAPILKIDENDVKASHAAIVGKLNDEHIFYLCSRGLSEAEAKRLIILGYLKPIEEYFDDALKARIDTAIEGGI